MIKDKSLNKKMSQRLDGFVKKLEDNGQTQECIDPIINLARALQCNIVDDSYSDSEEDSDTTSMS